jgi:O-antigen ligase
MATATAPLLGLACYLTFSRGALGATAAGLAVLVALAPTVAQARRVAAVTGAAVLAAAATIVLPAVEAPGGSGAQGAAMVAVLAVLAAAAAISARPAPASRLVPGLRAAAVGALALALVATAVAVTRVERTGSGPAQGASPARLVSAQSNRYEYWRVAVREFGDAPLQGGGSGSFRTDWLRERPIEETVRDAHSLYFETAAELGLVGLAALALFLGGIVAMARRSPHAAGAIAALAVYAIHAGLDWDWEIPALTLVALTLAARLAAADAPPAAS